MPKAPVNPLVAALWASVADFAERMAAARAVIQAHESDDAAKMLAAMRPTHNLWPQVEELQATLTALLYQIDQENEPNVSKPSDEQVAAAREEASTIHSQVGPTLKLLEANDPAFSKDNVPEVLTKRMPSAAGGQTGVKRPRVSLIVVSDLLDKEGKKYVRSLSSDASKPNEKATFTVLADILSKNSETEVTTGTCQEHYFSVVADSLAAENKDAADKARTGDLSGVPEGHTVEYAQTVGEKHYTVKITK